ncbi:MAG: ABC transporter ATP-binding protein [Verrucomicrobiaceae bacterium]|nr:ABC transporter ATP-binding protein [Verrucomicrobiaceae bacterium]
MPAPSPLKRLLAFALRHRSMALLQLSLAIAGTLLILVFPGIVQRFIDEIIPSKQTHLIWSAGGLAVAAFLVREMLFYVRTRVNTEFEQRMIIDLRSQLHRKISHLPIAWFDRQSTGDILTKMADDVPATQRVILEGIEQGFTATMQILIVAAMMFAADWKLTLIILAPTPFIAAGGWIYSRWVSPRSTAAREAASALNATLHDTLAGIRQIKSYTAEDLKRDEFLAASNVLRKRQTHLMAAWAFYSPSMTFLGSLGLVILLMVGASWCIAGNLTTGGLMRFILLVGFLYEPIARLHGVNQTLMNGLSAAKRVFDILDQEGEEDLETGRDPNPVTGHLVFENLRFGYRPEVNVLNDVSFEVKPRQTVAFVGGTGSGKTTLFQLLTRFYDPQQGRITLDGTPITELAKGPLRDAIAYVTQDAFLFAGTIRSNLLLGHPSATEDELWTALRQACAETFVKAKPDGLDSQVGERGVLLSGGERQRITIARAFLKDAPILLLDEATSAVDNQSEHLIQQALKTLQKDRTSLVIAHRLSTIIDADVIHVLRQGRLLARGTHAELLETCPYYAELAAQAEQNSPA